MYIGGAYVLESQSRAGAPPTAEVETSEVRLSESSQKVSRLGKADVKLEVSSTRIQSLMSQLAYRVRAAY